MAAAKAAIGFDRDFGEAWMCQGCCQRQLGRGEEAVSSLERATQLAPSTGSPITTSDCAWSISAVPATLSPRRRAVRINPDHALGWGLLVCLHSVAGNWKEALAATDQSTRLRPDCAALWRQCADVLWAGLADHSRARDCLAKAFALDPENEQARLISRVMEETGNNGVSSEADASTYDCVRGGALPHVSRSGPANSN